MFGAKKPQKNGVFGVFRSALKHFAILLYDPDDAQTYRISVQLDAQGCRLFLVSWHFWLLKTVFRGSAARAPDVFGACIQVYTKTQRNFTV